MRKIRTGTVKKVIEAVMKNGAAKPATCAMYPPTSGPTIQPKDKKDSAMPIIVPNASLPAYNLQHHTENHAPFPAELC